MGGLGSLPCDLAGLGLPGDIFDGDIIQKDNDLFLVFYDDGVPMYKGIKRRIVDRFLLTNRSE